MRILHSYIRFVDRLNEKIGFYVSWITSLLVLVVCLDVFTRYFLKKSSVAVQEMEWHLFAIIFLFGAAYTLKHDRHVRVDVFYTKFKTPVKAWIDLLGSLIFLIPFSILIIWSSKIFVINSFLINEVSPDPGGLPARYLLKACIPIGFFWVLLQGVSHFFKSLLNLRKTIPTGVNDE
jgi:TRAP-type mannitol/chloroaromatic compound transport system permease small subunit